MAINNNIYDSRFYDNTFKFEGDSAPKVADILIKYFNPGSVIDIGCGIGIYLKEFENRGIEILGFDGSKAALKKSLVKNKVNTHDLSEPLKLNKKFDLCLCIEVAEHIEPEYSEILVKSLTGLSENIFFTAATPGQGPRSIGHINERPHQFWIEQFAGCKFDFQKKQSAVIRTEMEKENVIWWITKNLMIFKGA